MKKLFKILTIAAALSVFTFTHANSQDTNLARIDDVKKTEGVSSSTENQTSKLNEGRASEQTNVEPQSKFILPVPNEKSSKGLLNNKVGPQGEEVYIENRKYYYINSEGQKIKIKSTELREKPKHS